ncbi:DUF411 domain-containing protein [Azohydromonas caseinilytica]|uniref:DUF411 domain-containing protein n=1 Tax=Azohydromonas caseinilytica TaxID=2728836 RepID=A0A848FER6_9BURK|nr:DUF411 domain-containing protein [Azohydromonas caseinilytica]NML17566.1 DUF411 domain-containing protein [Azohydromonas caseinilytica]
MKTSAFLPDTARRRLLRAAGLAALAAGAAPVLHAATPAAPTKVQLWKSPSCGCCKDWVTHMQSAGFDLQVFEVQDTGAQRARLGLPAKYGSCHTGLVEGYVIEGHVPAADVRRLLRERPDALALTVPGMVVGSPGMDGPEYGGRRERYEVLLVQRDGSSRVWATYNA